MNGLSLGIFVESAVALLLLLSIGYSFVLNERLKRLHADRDTMRQMIADLVRATDMANGAIKGLKASAVEADMLLRTRLSQAENFGIELANHVSAGHSVMERIAEITRVVEHSQAIAPRKNTSRAKDALKHLTSHQDRKRNAA